ncbi:MAG TPA: asparagine synthase (glutamine-hydrolyzing) [Devosiaceae bacterium]|jgi:asparagine synthase (glutamine-hydrolysing)|nr:asparagine synthase (glutamine-hydrolyzing) [Devosiaceae bacterium]
MCGIAGFLQRPGDLRPHEAAAVASRMADAVAHRGPDAAGVWIDEAVGIALGHRRLAIVDLSPAGGQPMQSPCGRYVLAYNGEIYNHLDLRAELESEGGHFDWRGHSDTEILLAALRHWGVETALRKLNGMFAFALWDRSLRTLCLARDRLGEKPLYYGRSGASFLFGSELKSLATHPHWQGELDREALTLYLRHSCVPAPRSIYRGISKLPPAHYLMVGANGQADGAPRAYWSLPEGSEPQETTSRDPTDATEQLDALLRDAVGRRMVADVPVGTFLSGGVDSSTVTALMQAQSSRRVKSFSIGFASSAYDEAPFARAVADHLGTDHTELVVTPQEALAVIPQLPAIWDEPFADSSQIATFLVSRLAREQVKVSLSGDGGDELFCGYNRYTRGYQVWRQLQALPAPFRATVVHALSAVPDTLADRAAQLLRRSPGPLLSDRLAKLAAVLAPGTPEGYYLQAVSTWADPSAVVLGGNEPGTIASRPEEWPHNSDLRETLSYLDTLTYLPDDILTKVDRASMAVGLEARVPLLDHRVVEFARALPMGLKYRDGRGKWLLRQVLHRYVPPALIDRPKTGFAVPIDEWLRGPLRSWTEGLLDERRLRDEGVFDPRPLRIMWEQHLSGRRRWHHQLWSVLMFQAWKDATSAGRLAPGEVLGAA